MEGNIACICISMTKISNAFLFSPRNVLSSVKEVLDFEKGVTILDVGCGSGVWVMVSDSSE
jgi:ribosomal protein L11 methylase PrmA